MNQIAGRIEDWSICRYFGGPIPPNTQTASVTGNVFGHSDFDDGKWITTSDITFAHHEGGKTFVRTKTGSLYELGVVRAEYEKIYPNAAERLVQSFK